MGVRRQRPGRTARRLAVYWRPAVDGPLLVAVRRGTLLPRVAADRVLREPARAVLGLPVDDRRRAGAALGTVRRQQPEPRVLRLDPLPDGRIGGRCAAGGRGAP